MALDLPGEAYRYGARQAPDSLNAALEQSAWRVWEKTVYPFVASRRKRNAYRLVELAAADG